MKTFTSKPTEADVTFQIDDDVFTAIPPSQMPGGVLDAYFTAVKAGEIFEAHHTFFEFALTEESYKLFEERFTAKTDKPITITMLADVSTYLLGEIYMGEGGDTGKEQPSSSGPPAKPGGGSTPGVV